MNVLTLVPLVAGVSLLNHLLYLSLDAAGYEALPALSLVMLAFVIPLTAVTLAVSAARSSRRRPRKAA